MAKRGSRFMLLAAALLGVLVLASCGSSSNGTQSEDTAGGKSAGSYQQIDQDTAKTMMEADDGHVVVDVRRADEYESGHIPGAILIPNESIGTEMPAELPDKDQVILVYCRSGNRSKQAAQKLADLGYTQVFEFGGINTWTGDIVSGDAA